MKHVNSSTPWATPPGGPSSSSCAGGAQRPRADRRDRREPAGGVPAPAGPARRRPRHCAPRDPTPPRGGPRRPGRAAGRVDPFWDDALAAFVAHAEARGGRDARHRARRSCVRPTCRPGRRGGVRRVHRRIGAWWPLPTHGVFGDLRAGWRSRTACSSSGPSTAAGPSGARCSHWDRPHRGSSRGTPGVTRTTPRRSRCGSNRPPAAGPASSSSTAGGRGSARADRAPARVRQPGCVGPRPGPLRRRCRARPKRSTSPSSSRPTPPSSRRRCAAASGPATR